MENNISQSEKDEILIEKYKNGDKSSLEKIYIKHKKSLLKLIWYYVHNIEDAEDILQTVFEKLIKNIYKYKKQEGTSFKTYLYKITINSCKDFLRRKSIRNLLKLDSIKEVGEIDKNINKIERNEIIRQIHKSVRNLPVKYRDVIILIYYENLKYEEVADILNKPVGTIKSRSNYALNLLRKKLEEFKYEL